MDRESQIKAIEKTFDDNKITIEKHYSKPGVVAVEVSPVFPDFKLWKYPCAQVIFDSDPAPSGRSVPSQIEEMSQAMIRYNIINFTVFLTAPKHNKFLFVFLAEVLWTRAVNSL